LRPQGFISNTLSQGVTGTIRGTWAINGKTITLKITSAEDERVNNSVTSSTILAFNQDELSMKSDRGETSTFTRVTPFRPNAEIQPMKEPEPRTQ
jgi:hypothetical protein